MTISRPRATARPDQREARRDERHLARAARRARLIRGVGGSLIAVGALAYLVWWSPLLGLDIEAVEVTYIDSSGQEVNTREGQDTDVLSVIHQYAGIPLPRIDADEMQTAIEELPGVSTALVERAWPDGVNVAVQQRLPVAAVADSQGGFALLDSSARVMEVVSDVPEGLPVVDVPVGPSHEAVLQSTLEVVTHMSSELTALVESISATSVDSVELRLSDGTRVVWGSSEDSSLKSEVLFLLLSSGAAIGANRIDVSAPDLPIVATDPVTTPEN